MSSQVPKPAIMKLSSDATLTMIQSVRNDPFQVSSSQLGHSLGHSLGTAHSWPQVGQSWVFAFQKY